MSGRIKFEVGMEIAPYVIETVDPGRMKTMALLLDDPNPIHWDTEVTEKLGLGNKAINQGPINLAFLMQAAIRAAGDGEELELVKFSTRFLGNTFSGDTVECTGTVTDVDASGRRLTLELRAVVEDRSVLVGTAELAW
jgi:acyl dehydratase